MCVTYMRAHPYASASHPQLEREATRLAAQQGLSPSRAKARALEEEFWRIVETNTEVRLLRAPSPPPHLTLYEPHTSLALANLQTNFWRQYFVYARLLARAHHTRFSTRYQWF